MYDLIIIGAGLAGTCCGAKTSKFCKTLLIDAHENEDNLPIKTNLFIKHNFPFVEDLNLDYSDQDIFSKDHLSANFMGKEKNGVIDSREFGDPLGKMIYTENLLKKLLSIFQDNGGDVVFNEYTKQVMSYPEYVEVKTDKNEYKGKALAIATGSHEFSIQKSLGFEVPDKYTGVYLNLYGKEETIEENFLTDYTYHINTKISKTGPFFMNKGRDRISTGYLGDLQSGPNEIIDKLMRILKNYDRIQPFMKSLKADSSAKVVRISKHPIDTFSKNRTVVLGEAAGLVTAFFYEGILGCVASADFAANTLKEIFENDKPITDSNLRSYDLAIKRILLESFFRNGSASEYMFYNASSSMKVLWDTYVDLINENKTLRRYIYDAHVLQDLSKYDISRDRWTGERIFGKLPTLSKIALGAKFLRALLKL